MITLATPVFGVLVVNGYVETSADINVAELKKVVLPVFVFPINPSLMGIEGQLQIGAHHT